MPRACTALAFAAILSSLNAFTSAKKVLELGLIGDLKAKAVSATAQKESIDTDLVGISPSQQGIFFSIDIAVGSDKQPVRVQIDTGSSDLWIPDIKSSICQDPKNLCSEQLKGGPTYFGGIDPSTSTTLEPQGDLGEFFITYVDGTEVHGDFAKDTVAINGKSVSNAIIAVADNASSAFPLNGIMGVGFTTGEAGVGRGTVKEHPNFPVSLKDQGLISTLAYSVYLNDAGMITLRNHG